MFRILPLFSASATKPRNFPTPSPIATRVGNPGDYPRPEACPRLAEAGIRDQRHPFTGRGYEGLPIADGDAASREYLRITLGEGVDDAERERVRAALRDYCRLDSEGMALIVEEMRRLAGS
jgi:hypothetical protein